MYKLLKVFVFSLFVGMFFVPTAAFACASTATKSCCKAESTKKTEKKSCCDASDSKKETKNCGGKCGHANCTSASSVNFSVITTFDYFFKKFSIDFYSKKSIFYTSKTFISSGFISVWLPPKIK